MMKTFLDNNFLLHNDMDLLGSMIEEISYFNAVAYFGTEV